MVSETTLTVLALGQLAAALLTVLVLLRIAYILSANPIGEFTQELLYLRIRELRQAGYMLFLVLLVELAQMLLPSLVQQGFLLESGEARLMLDAAQAVLILAAGVMVLLVVRRYTHRALDRRIRESMETLAYLEGQRRRRRAESGRGEPEGWHDED